MLAVYLPRELEKFRFAELGENVLIKRMVQFYNPRKIALESNIIIDDYSVISAGEMVHIDNNVHIHSQVCLYGRHGIELQDFSCVSARTVLYTESDDFSGNSLTGPTVPDEYKPHYKTGKIVAGRHTVIGTNSTAGGRDRSLGHLPGVK
jgi:acetyltransferase-like isoleucine patch superfamily enzyme